jgi:hypothetical protein
LSTARRLSPKRLAPIARVPRRDSDQAAAGQSFEPESSSRPTHRSRTGASASSSHDPMTAPQEPVLIPKLRTHYADFPCLHSLNWPEPMKLGDLMRFLVRPDGRIIHSARFSWFVGCAADGAVWHRFTGFRTASPDKPIPQCSLLNMVVAVKLNR